MLTKKGGPEVLETVELPLPEPRPGEVRVKVRATGVGATDIAMRRGFYPYAPRIPFVPGYESIGIVDAVGAGVTTLKEGDRVCALLVHGGYATHVVRSSEHWVKVPAGLDDVQAVALILNYVTAYQMIHRVARLRIRGRAGISDIGALRSVVVRGRPGEWPARVLLRNYQAVQKDPQPFLEDLPRLFDLLAQRKISPRIAQKFPLLDAREANERLEAGGIERKGGTRRVGVAVRMKQITSREFGSEVLESGATGMGRLYH